jgi:AmiR/NasT family two-component response regulator
MRVIIADDAPALRAAYRRDLTELGADVVADAGSPSQLMADVRLHRPDSVLLDINFGGHRGKPRDDEGLAAAELELNCAFTHLTGMASPGWAVGAHGAALVAVRPRPHLTPGS